MRLHAWPTRVSRTLFSCRRVEIAVALLIVLVEASFFHPTGWNQNARLAATMAFVEPNTDYTGTFRIDGLKSGDRLNTEDWAESHGAYYSNKAPGVSLLGVVPYYVLYHLERSWQFHPRTPQHTQLNAYLLNLWISVFWNVVAALMLIRRLPRLGVHSKAGAVLVALVYSFATLVLPFGCTEWGHSTAAAFITLGLLYLLDSPPSAAATAGFWFGAALLTEYLAGLSLVLAGLFVMAGADRWRRSWRFALGAAPPVLALLVYQKICFGSYLTTAPSLSNAVFLRSERIAGLFSAPDLTISWRILFDAGRGLFYQMPVLFLSAAGLESWYRSRHRAYVALAAANIALFLLVISAMADGWGGGVTSSMRYMIIALPYFCLLLPEPRASGHRAIFVSLFAISAANMFILAATSTMYFAANPLADLARAAISRGEIAFNPLLTSYGVHGGAFAAGIAVIYAVTLVWLLGVVRAAPDAVSA